MLPDNKLWWTINTKAENCRFIQVNFIIAPIFDTFLMKYRYMNDHDMQNRFQKRDPRATLLT